MRPDIACVVPARLGSVRFPGKLLRPLLGKPVVVHALERAAEAECFSEIVCFTDSELIGEAVAAHGFRFVLTGPASNGTERIALNLEALHSDRVVDLQGDEPAFPPEGLRVLCAALAANPGWVHTLVHSEPPPVSDLADPNRVKARMDPKGFVLDFVRSAAGSGDYRLHLGAYAYSKEYLRRYAATPSSERENALSHEMLRRLDLAPVRAHFSPPGASVDVPADLERAEARLRAMRPAGLASALQGDS